MAESTMEVNSLRKHSCNTILWHSVGSRLWVKDTVNPISTMNSTHLSPESPTVVFYFTNGKKVDKGTNRQTPGTSGEGPRPPQKKDLPDKDKKDKQAEKINNEQRDKNKKR